MLALSDVQVVYEGAAVATRGVSLAVPEASVVALLGPNGAGKSTTLKAIAGLLVAKTGRRSYREVKHYKRKKRWLS